MDSAFYQISQIFKSILIFVSFSTAFSIYGLAVGLEAGEKQIPELLGNIPMNIPKLDSSFPYIGSSLKDIQKKINIDHPIVPEKPVAPEKPVVSEKPVAPEIPVAPKDPPLLVEAGFRGFNIVKYNDQFFGVDQQEGPINVVEISEKAKFKFYIGSSIEDVREKIDKDHPLLPLTVRIKNKFARLKIKIKKTLGMGN